MPVGQIALAVRFMDADRTTTALARIDAALARIEAAAAHVRDVKAAGAELERLRARHGKLRAAVSDGLQQLDLLIEGAQG